MTDIAMFGLGFESSGIKEAEKRLNDLDKAGKKTQSVLDENSKSSEKLDKKTSKLADSIDKSSSVLNKNTTAIDRNGNKISEADVALGRFKDTHGRMRESNGQFVKGLSHTDEALGRVSKSANKASSMLGKLSGVMGGISAVALGRGMLSMAFNFDDAMNTVQSKLLITGQEMESLKDKAKELGATTAFSATEAGQGMSFLAQAGLDANEILTATPTVLNLAAASGMDLARSADIATNVMGQFKLKVSDLPAIVDTLAMTSSSANTSVEEMAYAFKQTGSVSTAFGVNLQDTSAIIGMLANNGIKGETAGMAMKNMFSRLNGSVGPVNKVLKEFKLSSSDLFDTFDDGTIKFKGIKNMFDLFNKAGMNGVDMLKIFGAEAGPAMLSITKSGDDIESLSEKISKSGAASEMAELRMQGLVGVSKIARSTWEALNLTLADKGGRAIAISGLESLISVMQSVMDNTKEWGVGIAALAAIIMRSQIVAVSAAIKSNWLLVTSSIAATKAQYSQATSSGVLGRASTTAAIAVRGLHGVMSLLGGPLGVITLAATALFTYKEEIIKAISQTGQLETATSDLNKITKKAKDRAYEYADASDTVKESLEKQTVAEINSAKAKLEATKANVALAQSNLARAKSLDKIGSDDPFHVSLTDTRERELAAEMKIMQAQQNTIDEVISTLNNFGKTKTQLNDIYKRSNKPIKEEEKSTSKLVNTNDKLNNSKNKTLSTYERELQAVTKAKIAKTQGAEAAYRYELSLQKITGKQADLLVSIKKQSGAFDVVKKSVNKTISEYERASQALTESNIRHSQGELAAYKYAISLKSISEEEQKLLIGLKKQEIAYKLAEENKKKAEKTAKDAAKAKSDEAKKIKDYYDSEVVGLNKTIIKRNQGEEALYRYELAQNKITGSQADLLVSLKKQSGAWSDNKTSYEKTKESSEKFKSSSKSLSNELSVLTEKLRGNNDAARLLELQYSGLDSKQAKIILSDEKEKESKTKLLEIKERFKQLNKDNANELALLNEKLNGNNESVRLLELTQQKYNDNQSKKILADEKEKKRITDLIDIRDKYNNLVKSSSERLEVLRLKALGNNDAARLLELTNKGFNDTQAKKILNDEKEELAATKKLDVYKKTISTNKSLTKQEKLLSIELAKGTKASKIATLVLDGYSKKQAESELADKSRIDSLKNIVALSDSLADSLTDNILSGDFKQIGNKLTDKFKTDILNPLIENAIKPATNQISKMFNGVSDGIKGMMSGKGMSGIFSAFKNTKGGLSGAFGGAGMGAGIASMTGGDTKWGSIGGSIGGLLTPILGPFSSAIGGAIGSLVPKIFGGKKTVEDQGIEIKYSGGDFSGQSFKDMKKEGGWFRSDKYWTEFSKLNDNTEKSINDFFDTVEKTLINQASDLGVNSANEIISNFNTGKVRLESSEDVQKWATDITDDLYKKIFSSFKRLKKEGEDFKDTVNRISNQFSIVSDGFKFLGLSLPSLNKDAIIAADVMTSISGSIEKLSSSMESYYELIYTDAQKDKLSKKIAKERIDKFNNSIGLVGDEAIDTANELKLFVDAQDSSTKAGQEAIATAFGIADAISIFSGTAQEAADALADAAENLKDIATESEVFTSAIERMVEQLYGSSTESYNKELLRYNILKTGAESLLKTVKEFNNETKSNKLKLSDSQKEYNALLNAVRNGETDRLSDLQSAAKSLKTTLIEEYAGGSKSDIGINQIESQLIALSKNLESQAGIKPVAPEKIESTLNEADRALLADVLLTSLQESALAEDKTVSELMASNGVYINQLADDLGVNLDSIRDASKALSLSEINQLKAISQRIGIGNIDLMKELGVNASTISKTISSNLRVLPDVPNNIKIGLSPYLSAIEKSNDYSVLENILSATRGYISTLPADIQNKINSQLNNIVSSNMGNSKSIDLLSDLTKTELNNIGYIFGITNKSIKDSVNGMNSDIVKSLFDMSKLLNTDIVTLGNKLGINTQVIANAVNDSLSDLSGIPSSIASNLSPYLLDIKNSNNTESLNTSLSLMSEYIKTLPTDIQNQLNSKLYGIIQSNNNTNSSILKLTDLSIDKISDLAKLFGISDDLIKKSLDETKEAIKETFKIPEKYLAETRDNISLFGNKLNDAITKGDSSLLYMLSELSKNYNVSSVNLANQLGYDIKSIVNPLTKTFNSLPNFIKDDLEPLLNAIKESNDYSNLEHALKLTYTYINTLPENIQKLVKPVFDKFNLSNDSIKSSIDSLSVLTKDNLDKLKDNFGVNSKSIENAVSGSGQTLFNGLQSMSKLFNTDILSLGVKLNLSNEAIKNAIMSGLSNIPSLPDNIRSLLEPLLKDIESSNNNDDLQKVLINVGGIIETLPSGVSSGLSGVLSAIDVSVNNSSRLLTDKLSVMSKSLNTDLVSLSEKLGINSKVISNSIQDSLSSLDGIPENIKSGLAPYLLSIKNSNNYDSLKLSLNEVNKYLNSLPDGIQSKLSNELLLLLNSSNKTNAEIYNLANTTSNGLNNLTEKWDGSFQGLVDSVQKATSFDDIVKVMSNLETYTALLPDDIRSSLHKYFTDLIDSNNMINSNIKGLNYGEYSDLIGYLDKAGVNNITNIDELISVIANAATEFGIKFSDVLNSSNISVSQKTSVIEDKVLDYSNSMKDLFKPSFFDRLWKTYSYKWGKSESNNIRTLLSSLTQSKNEEQLKSSSQALAHHIKELIKGQGSTPITSSDVEILTKIYDILPQYNIGSDYISENQAAIIHKGESIFTAEQTSSLRANSINALKAVSRIDRKKDKQSNNDELNKQLIAEIKELKEAQKAANYQLAKNTKDTYRLLDRWEGAGMPTERATA